MNKLTAAALAALTTVLTVSACSADTTTATSEPAVTGSMSESTPSGEAMVEDSTMEASHDDEMADGAMESAGTYLDYDAYEAGMSDYADATVVLFFHADWCPDCQATDAALTADGVPDGLVVVKVDYDDSDELKRKYGVTQQHTFVQVDGTGTELAKWTGSGTGEDILAETA